MRKYLANLITEKGRDLDSEIEPETGIEVDGVLHCGLTFQMLIDFICQPEMREYHLKIRETLVKIDFMNGDVFHYLKHLAAGMVAAAEV